MVEKPPRPPQRARGTWGSQDAGWKPMLTKLGLENNGEWPDSDKKLRAVTRNPDLTGSKRSGICSVHFLHVLTACTARIAHAGCVQ